MDVDVSKDVYLQEYLSIKISAHYNTMIFLILAEDGYLFYRNNSIKNYDITLLQFNFYLYSKRPQINGYFYVTQI